MNASQNPDDLLATRRKRALFRAWHRGIREMDIVLGGFAERSLASLDEAQLAEFEAILELHDRDLIRWVTGEEAAPSDVDTPLWRAILGVAA